MEVLILEKVKVIIWGFGAMGSGMARLLLKKKGVEIVGVCDLDPLKVGRNMYDVLETKSSSKAVLIHDNHQEIIKDGHADIVLLATDSFVKGAFDKIKYCVEKKMNVISTAEEMAYPKAKEPKLSKEMDNLAKENNVTILGTGINPGFVLDLLIIALTGTCETIENIKALRVNDLSPFGPTVMVEQGVGLTVEKFNEGLKNSKIVGHVGFNESINMITDAIGWKLEKVTQTKEAIVSKVYRKNDYVEIKAGNVAGCRQCGYGYVDGEIKIEMEHPQQIKPELEGVNTGDFITINGVPDISLQIKPEIPGGIGTISMTVNMIPHVINAEAGLKTMLELPIPRAIMGNMADLIKK
ncbi:2,4-diaminopentanoate dehydrogenase [subsurface metagenome]